MDFGDSINLRPRARSLILRANKFLDSFEELADVSVDRARIFGLTNNFKQVFVGDEEEPREVLTLGLEELVQVFSDAFKDDKQLLQLIQERVIDVRDQSFFAHLDVVNSIHFFFELHMNSVELCVFRLQKQLNVLLTHEDALEVLPHRLHLHQHFKVFRNSRNVGLPHVNVFSEFSVVH